MGVLIFSLSAVNGSAFECAKKQNYRQGPVCSSVVMLKDAILLMLNNVRNVVMYILIEQTF